MQEEAPWDRDSKQHIETGPHEEVCGRAETQEIEKKEPEKRDLNKNNWKRNPKVVETGAIKTKPECSE